MNATKNRDCLKILFSHFKISTFCIDYNTERFVFKHTTKIWNQFCNSPTVNFSKSVFSIQLVCRETHSLHEFSKFPGTNQNLLLKKRKVISDHVEWSRLYRNNSLRNCSEKMRGEMSVQKKSVVTERQSNRWSDYSLFRSSYHFIASAKQTFILYKCRFYLLELHNQFLYPQGRV